MQSSKFDKFLAISGILAGLLFVVAGFHDDPPGLDSSAQSRLDWFVDHKTWLTIGGLASAYFAVVMAFFATGVRRLLRSGEAGESTYSSAALVGGVLVSGAGIFGAMTMLASVEAADNGNAAALTTISYVNEFGWLPLIASLAVFYLATGLGGLRTATLPKWLSIVTIVLGVACVLGPAGIAAWFATPLWLIVVGVIMLRRSSDQSVPVTSGATPSYAGRA
jgi:hypothetical protein